MKKLALVLTISAAAITIAGKPAQPPAAANPEIAYIDSRPKLPELKLANADLTGAFLVYRSNRQGATPSYDLSPRGQNQIAVTSAGIAELVTWSSSGSVVSVSKAPLTAPGNAERITFSPDGTRIGVYYIDDPKLRIFDASTRQVVAEWPVPHISSMTYIGDGSKIAFIALLENKIFEIDVVTGAVTGTEFTLGKLNFLGGGHGSNALLVTYRANEAIPESLYLARWLNGAVVADRFVQGWDAQYNCDETRIVYRAVGSSPDTRIYNVTTGGTNLLTRNQDIRRVDFMPTC